jgi:hypothetical protein
MTDKPDPAKDAGRTDNPGAKRPHATLDLKATEVKAPASPAPATGSSGTASSASATPGASSSSSSTASAASPSSPGSSSTSTAKPSSGTSTTDASAKAAPGAASKAAPAAAKPETKASGGGFFSHLAAGLIGGGLVYAGAAVLQPGWLPNSSSEAVSQLSSRIAALESAPKESPALAAKISEAEGRLAKLDQIEQSVTQLRDAQGTLAAETKSLKDAAESGAANGGTERVAKLEEQLALIASGAPASDGRIPQLAALAGKISDVESSLSAQLAELRKSLPAEVDARITATQEASEAAKAATSRLDREVAQLRTDQARSAQRDEATKADTERLSAAVEAVKEEAGKLSSTIGELRASIETQIKALARPADVSAAVSPVASKLAELEHNVQSVVKSEATRKENAERIVLSLELSNLKRALDRGQGQGYAAEIEEVRKVSGGQLDLSALDRFKDTGVATVAELKASFRPVMNAVIDADLEPADGSVIDRLLAGAKSVVRVRRVSHDAEDTSAEAVVSRIETALNEGRLGDVIALAKTLPQRAQAPIEDWLTKVAARNSVDEAIAAVDEKLKASLSGTAEAAPAAPAPVQN